MNHTCQHCSYESPPSARFCRQCGAQLFVESELSAAGTRNFDKQEPALSVAAAGSGHLPPSVADAIAGETARYYQAQPYIPAPPPASSTARIKSRIGNWGWFVLLIVMITGAAIGSYVTGRMIGHGGDSRSPEERAQRQQRDDEIRRQREQRKHQDELRRQAQNQMREAENRSREALNRAREAMRRAEEAARQASEAGAALAPTDEKLLDFSQFDYPGATVSSSIRIPGREMHTMRTTDSFDAVDQFYQKKLGEPILKINDSIEKRLIFQSDTPPLISVSVETVPGPAGPELKIVVLRSPFRFSRPDETQK